MYLRKHAKELNVWGGEGVERLFEEDYEDNGIFEHRPKSNKQGWREWDLCQEASQNKPCGDFENAKCVREVPASKPNETRRGVYRKVEAYLMRTSPET